MNNNFYFFSGDLLLLEWVAMSMRADCLILLVYERPTDRPTDQPNETNETTETNQTKWYTRQPQCSVFLLYLRIYTQIHWTKFWLF